MIDRDAIHRAAPAPLELANRLGLKVARGSRRERVRVCCPWHNERNPSCSIIEKDGRILAHCFSCGEGGDIFALVGVVEGLSVQRDFRRVAERTAELVGVRLDDRRPSAARSPRRDPAVLLAMAIESAANDWFHGRNIRRADAECIQSATPGQLADALADLAELEPSPCPVESEDDYLDRKLEEYADKHERWERRPRWDGPFFTFSEPVTPEWRERWDQYRRDLDAWRAS